MPEQSRRLFDVVGAFFAESDWDVVGDEQAGTFTVDFQGTAGSWRCLGLVREEPQQVIFYSVLPVPVAADHRPR